MKLLVTIILKRGPNVYIISSLTGRVGNKLQLGFFGFFGKFWHFLAVFEGPKIDAKKGETHKQ